VTTHIAKYCYVVMSAGWQAAVVSDARLEPLEVAGSAVRAFTDSPASGGALGYIIGVTGGHLLDEQYISTASVLESIGMPEAAALLRCEKQ